jgi:CRISPR-associated protein Cas8a1/Csx13
LALAFAPTGAIAFQVHRRAAGVRPHYCVVLPAVSNLGAYGTARRLFLRQGVKALHVAGTSEAAARVLAELEAHGVRSGMRGAGCTVISFGNVAWSQQRTRVEVFTTSDAPPQRLRVYRVATSVLHSEIVATKPDPRTGEVRRFWRVPQTPDLVARNVLAGRPWWTGFGAMWDAMRADAGSSERGWVLHHEREGLWAMVNDARTTNTEAEVRLVRACHEAWRRRLGELGEQARSQGSDFGSLYEREYERTRIGFARCKNAAMLRQTLTDFWARAGTLPELQEGWADLIPFLHDRWRDARDLALLALASYKGQEAGESQAPAR